jgi:hypothetical protein
MCRSIKTLYNYDPPATDDEIRAAALQYVRKVSGYQKPSKVNESAFDTAVTDIAAVTSRLIASLSTAAPRRDREAEAARKREVARARFG